MIVAYAIYFSLLDYMATIDQNSEHERQWFQNMEVLWGLYDTNRILQNQAEGQADDVANVLIPIIPLFAILCACFIYKELDKWFRTSFDVTIPTNYKIEREARRIDIKRERDVHRANRELQDKLREELLAGGLNSSDAGSKKDDEGKEKDDASVEDKKEGEEEKKDDEKKFYDQNGKEIDLDKDGDLLGLCLKVLLKQDEDRESIEQLRGDRTYIAGITNQYLI